MSLVDLRRQALSTIRRRNVVALSIATVLLGLGMVVASLDGNCSDLKTGDDQSGQVAGRNCR
jgi:hypothetical protein